ncbi:MAG: hypothetical protein R3F56_11165 [Planctomycetota bacterium]
MSILRTVCCALPVAASTACATGSHLDRLPDARELRASEPAPFLVAIGPLRLDEAVDRDAATGPLSADSLQETLVADLRDLRAASSIAAVVGDDLAAANAIEADLLLRPRLATLQFDYRGSTTEGLLSSLLWITTWVGGLFVPDSEYEARLRVDWDVVNPHNGQVITSLAGSSRSHRLDFFDRNPLLSLGCLQTLLIPPVFTSDDADRTKATLSALAIGHAASEVTRFLKAGLAGEERELLGQLRLDAPHNGEVVASGHPLRGALLAHEQIVELALLVNGEPLVELDAATLPTPSRQQVGTRTYRVPLPETPLPLRPGRNLVVIEYVTGGRRSSRTLSLECPTEEGQP